jgi:hypothetical protein
VRRGAGFPPAPLRSRGRPLRLLLLKLLATAGVAVLLALPFVDADARSGVLASAARVGLPALVVSVPAGAVALVLWIVHWRFIAQVNRLLGPSPVRSVCDPGIEPEG